MLKGCLLTIWLSQNIFVSLQSECQSKLCICGAVYRQRTYLEMSIGKAQANYLSKSCQNAGCHFWIKYEFDFYNVLIHSISFDGLQQDQACHILHRHISLEDKEVPPLN